jgi:hypothetical protein
MPPLSWSVKALSVVRGRQARDEVLRLFDAYFRSAEDARLIGTSLPLELPSNAASPYRLVARFHRATGWTVQAELKHENRKIVFVSSFPHERN